MFDGDAPGPWMHKLTSDQLTAPDGGWVAVGEDSRIGPGRAEGRCGEAEWSLRFATLEPELRHLRPDWLYRAPLPRTKLTSPAPAARFDGRLTLPGGERIELRDWPGMVGHNWGAEHAERWIWLHGIAFAEQPEAWLDVALGRLRVAGRMTPWVANGALFIGGRLHRVGGLGARGLHVDERPDGARMKLVGRGGLALDAHVRVPDGAAAGWRYADPDGGEHDVVNCSIAALEIDAHLPGAERVALRTAHGCAYELGMRERDHGVTLAPFGDG